MRRIGLISLILVAVLCNGQNPVKEVTLPRASQKAVVSQEIGISEIKVQYSRPNVSERTVWGELVPYDQMWRAGANENTIFTTTHEIEVQGHKLPAGSYGMFMIPSEKGQWIIVFSSFSEDFGNFSYREKEDALRVNVLPKPLADFHETLTYDFMDVQPDGATLTLKWEKLLIPILLKLHVHQIVLTNFEKELRALPGASYLGYDLAANYCLQNNFSLEKGLEWANQAVLRNESYVTLQTKFGLLKQLGRQEEAKKVNERSVQVATVNELNNHFFQLLGADFQQSRKQAFELAAMNIKKNPDNGLPYANMGTWYLTASRDKKNVEKAIYYYEEALKREGLFAATSDALKDRIAKGKELLAGMK